MPPRIPTKLIGALAQETTHSSSLKPHPDSTFDLLLRLFSSTPTALHKSRGYKPRIYKDPWLLKRQAAKREAIAARLDANAEAKTKAKGDPIRGGPSPTPFVSSLDTALDPGHAMLNPAETTTANSEAETSAGQGPDLGEMERNEAQALLKEQKLKRLETDEESEDIIPKAAMHSSEAEGAKPAMLNHFMTQEGFQSALENSREFTTPYISTDRSVADVAKEEKELAQHAELHSARREALVRIMAPENASAKERLLINKRRIIEKFGRHNTDQEFAGNVTLVGKQGGESGEGAGSVVKAKERIGPDTGSSEVQIAILTAKIKAVADRWEGHEGRFDRVNKRNLRLLLHRRQKLLKYFERQDRGGPRWRHLLETLGLTEATWKGEIEVR